MEELKIGEVIFALRKEKGLTQEEFGNIVGVSKGAVSKWEVGTSYPDIVLLPKIAGFFNISIDKLIGFNSEISDDKMDEIYKECSELAFSGDVENTIEKTECYIKKYRKNYKLKLLLASTMLMAAGMMKDEEKIRGIKNKVIKIYEEIMDNSNNQDEVESSILILATFYAEEDRYSDAYLILDRVKKYNKEASSIKGSLLLKEGKVKEARKIHQEILLGSIGNIQSSLMAIGKSYEGEIDKQIETLEILEKIYRAFTEKEISKGLSSIYVAKAQVFARVEDKDKTLENIEEAIENLNADVEEIKEIFVSEIEKCNHKGLDGNKLLKKMLLEELEDEKYDFIRRDNRFIEGLKKIK